MTRDGFASEPAQRHHRVVFTVIIAVVCAIAALAFADASLPLPQAPAFLPTYVTTVIFADLVTCYLIFTHAPMAGRASLPWLGGAYLFTAAIAFAQMLVFPGVWSATGLLGAGPQSAVWLWVFWHGGFAALVLASQIVALRQRRHTSGRPIRMRRRHTLVMSVFVLAVVLELVLLATRWEAWLPALIRGNDYGGLATSGPGMTVTGLTVVALVAVILGTRGRSLLDLGLIVALVAALVDVVLTLHGGARFSLGWYVARCAAVLSGVAVLAVYLREVAWLHARVLRLNARLAEQAAMDATTGLHNRRHLNRQLDLALRDSRRRGEEVSLVLLDVDRFKAYNDRYGHLAGDDCLRRVAAAIAASARRPQDLAARYGGEEFAVLLPSTGIEGAHHVGTTIVDAVRALAIDHTLNAPAGVVTVSAGVATVAPGGRMEDLIRQADRALYAAKDMGRDRVVGPEAVLA
jgi:diguanylate cyclase (GGDEF)-like protein